MFKQQLNQLANTFLEKNSQINLSAIRDLEWIKIKHINDSLELNKVLKIPEGAKVLDLWTWWGFPLLPLAITNPKADFTWIDSRRKKIQAIQEMINNLWLRNIRLVRWRIEEHKGNYDIITARAVSYIDNLLKRTKHLIKKWGILAFYKQYSPQEYKDMEKLLPRYKLKLLKIHHYKLFNDDIERIIYLLQKK